MLERHPEIELLFTDVGLPGGMNGRQLADAARKLRPDLKVLFTTGYARNAIVHHGRLDPGVQLITKPFTYAALAAKLGDMLDTRRDRRASCWSRTRSWSRWWRPSSSRELGYRVETAGSATEAMNKVKLLRGDIGLAIVDIGLPDRKGDVLVGELRALHPQLPIVIATGYDSAELDAALRGRSEGGADPQALHPGRPQDRHRPAAAALKPRRCAPAVRSATTARGRREGIR